MLLKAMGKPPQGSSPSPLIVKAKVEWTSREEAGVEQSEQARKTQASKTHLDIRLGFALCQFLITMLGAFRVLNLHSGFSCYRLRIPCQVASSCITLLSS